MSVKNTNSAIAENKESEEPDLNPTLIETIGEEIETEDYYREL